MSGRSERSPSSGLVGISVSGWSTGGKVCRAEVGSLRKWGRRGEILPARWNGAGVVQPFPTCHGATYVGSPAWSRECLWPCWSVHRCGWSVHRCGWSVHGTWWERPQHWWECPHLVLALRIIFITPEPSHSSPVSMLWSLQTSQECPAPVAPENSGAFHGGLRMQHSHQLCFGKGSSLDG